MVKKRFLQTIFFLLVSIGTQSALHAMTLDCSLDFSVLESLYTWWFKPDLTMPTLDQLNIVSFLPIDCSKDAVVSEDKEGRDGVITLLKKKEGTLKINGKLYKIYNEIPEEIKQFNGPINLYLGGFSNSAHPHAFSVYKSIKEGTMHGPCIVFECAPDNNRRAFNFGQAQDLHCVQLAYENLLEKNPNAQIILKGGCKGAAVYLRFLAEKAEQGENLENIKAFIANYPPISVKDALKDIRYGGVVAHLFCRFTLPNYNPNAKTILEAEAFPKYIPVLLSCLPQDFDRISNLDDMQRIKNHLDSLGAEVEFFVSEGKDSQGKKLDHGKLGRAPDYQEQVKAFLERKELLTLEDSCKL